MAGVAAPPGTTTLLVLPTGTGKSLCFQLLSLFGTGLTVVVVPTVAWRLTSGEALRRSAQDSGTQPALLRRPGPGPRPRGRGRGCPPRQTRLVFTSPEACVSGRLRRVLEEAAASHWLENLVIDEAHLVETWGLFFRVDFQFLATLQRRWL